MSTIIASALNIGAHDASSIALACKELSHHWFRKAKCKRTLAIQPPGTILITAPHSFNIYIYYILYIFILYIYILKEWGAMNSLCGPLFLKHICLASPSSPSYDIPIPLTNKRDIVLKLQKNTHWHVFLGGMIFLIPRIVNLRGTMLIFGILYPKPTNSLWIKAGRKTYALVLQQLDNEAKLRVAIHERTHRILQDRNYPNRYHK